MRTYIPKVDVPMIIQISGEEIRRFLSTASPDDFSGEAKSAIKDYLKDPKLFTDKHLVEYGSNIEQAINHPMRIEVRNITLYGAAQVVAKGIWGANLRQEVIKRVRLELNKLDRSIEVRLAGTS